MADTSIEWTEEVWNPTTGCDQVSAGCENCLAPDTKVLRADMTWVPIKDIHVGDCVVSFTETPSLGANRVWETATVEATWEVEKPTVEVELADGTTFVASEDHRWLIAKRGADAWWRKTIDLTFKTQLRVIRCEPTNTESVDYQAGYIAGVTAGDGTFRWNPSWRSSSTGDPQSYWRVAKLVDDRAVLERLVAYLDRLGVAVAVRPFKQGASAFTPDPRPMAKVETRRLCNMPIIAGLAEERDTREYKAGWLAGLFDTDASYNDGSLRYCQSKPNNVLDRVARYGSALGFEFAQERYDKQCPTARLLGGIAEHVAFLSAISPALERRCQDFYGRRIEVPSVAVVGIRRGATRRLIDIITSTGTFLAEGALTHNCYAKPLAKRLKAMGQEKYQTDGSARTSGPGFGLAVHEDTLDEPLLWRKPRAVFVNSMSDLFHAQVPRAFIAQVFAVMALTPQHTYQVLTKRHARMRSILTDACRCAGGHRDGEHFRSAMAWAVSKANPERIPGVPDDAEHRICFGTPWPLPNVHLGVSAESQRWADIRIPVLLDTPAAIRFVSAEPLIGPIDLDGPLVPGRGRPRLTYWLTGRPGWGNEHRTATGLVMQEPVTGPALDWVIVGGESGPRARPMDLAWMGMLVDQCRHSGVPVFVKQLGAVWRREAGARHPKGGDPQEWPEALRVRELPGDRDPLLAVQRIADPSGPGENAYPKPATDGASPEPTAPAVTR